MDCWDVWPCWGFQSPSSEWLRSSTPEAAGQTGRRAAAASARPAAACTGRRRTCIWRSAWWSACWRRWPHILQRDKMETCECTSGWSQLPVSVCRAAERTGCRVSDLPHRRVQLDVQTLGQRHGDARVAVPHRQVAAGELEVVVLRRRHRAESHTNKVLGTPVSWRVGRVATWSQCFRDRVERGVALANSRLAKCQSRICRSRDER